MATVVNSMALDGIEGFRVEVEATTLRGQPMLISIIGLGDQAVKEAGERIQAALQMCGYEQPKDKVIISLAPGNKRKRGSHYDLAMTIALLHQTDQIAVKNLHEYVIIGELSLNARVRPCAGILPMVIEAKKHDFRKVIVPYKNWKEAESVSGIEVFGVRSLRETVWLLEGTKLPERAETPIRYAQEEFPVSGIDFSDVKGQEELIDAIVLAAAGGHNILMIGEPGCGKTMIAQRIPTILPQMTEKEALEVTKIHSIAGLLEADHGLVEQRPFRAPHHNVSLNALIGGGTYAQPGEVSLAHNGVLFLDELAEHRKSTLDALRQPLEDRKVTISRVNGTNTYPSNFMFVAAMNPCPCGYYPQEKCRCTDYEIARYRGKLSGPILERIDIQKNVKHVDYFELTETADDRTTSAQLREKVERARKIQAERYKDCENVNCNAQMSTQLIEKFCKLDDDTAKMLREVCESYGVSTRVIHKLLRMARTAADLDGADDIQREHVMKVLACRDLDKSNKELYTIE